MLVSRVPYDWWTESTQIVLNGRYQYPLRESNLSSSQKFPKKQNEEFFNSKSGRGMKFLCIFQINWFLFIFLLNFCQVTKVQEKVSLFKDVPFLLCSPCIAS